MTLQWATFFLAVMSVIVIPILILFVRALVSITKVEQALKTIVEDMQEMKKDVGNDREATNKRLRWLEEYLWQRKA